MVTREELENYMARHRELKDLRARRRQAELTAMETERETDRAAAKTAAALYDALADECAEEMQRVEAAVSILSTPRRREIVRVRYMDGKSIVQIAARMGIDERTVRREIRAAMDEMRKG